MKRTIVALAVMLSGVAWAADTDPLTASWALGIATAVIGALLTTVFGLIQRENSRRFDEHAKNIGLLFSKTNDLRSDLQVNYHPKGEIRDVVGTAIALALGPLDRKIDALHSRLDARGFPRQHPEQDP